MGKGLMIQGYTYTGPCGWERLQQTRMQQKVSYHRNGCPARHRMLGDPVSLHACMALDQAEVGKVDKARFMPAPPLCH